MYHSELTLPVSCAPVDGDCHCTRDPAHSPRTPRSPPHHHPPCDIEKLQTRIESQLAVEHY